MPGAASPPLSQATEPAAEDASPEPPRPASGRRQALTLVLSVLLTAFAALVLTLLLDASSWAAPLNALRTRGLDSPTLVVSTVVVWLCICLIVAVTGRLWVSLGLAAAVAGLLVVVNRTKLLLRNEPLYPSDATFLKDAGFLVDMVSSRGLVGGAFGLLLVVALCAAAGWLLSKVFPPLHRSAGRRKIWILRGVRVLTALVCFGLLQLATNFNERDNQWRAAFESTGLRWRSWAQTQNYRQNGFVAGVLYNTGVTPMAEPAGYSRAAVERIAAKYAASAAAANVGRTDVIEKTNVVLVLSESFTDPTWLQTVKFASTPIPKTSALMKKTLSGRMLAPGFGGGTANVEYELLTGHSLSQLEPQLTTPYSQMVGDYESYPSAVKWFERNGHDSVAIHPFVPTMYDRPDVYETLGFDKFIAKGGMSFRGRGGGRFIDDESTYNEVLRQLSTNEKPLLTHVITMQNHMPYAGQYDDPLVPSGLPERNAQLAGQYARGLARSDDALASFLAKLEKQREPTAVVFYGDHLPAQVYPPDLQRREGLRTAHETPFLMWSNTKALRAAPRPTTSPTQFLPLLLDAMGARTPPWFALLSDLGKQVPAMDVGFAIDASNRKVRPSQLSSKAKAVLADYRMIMYDLSVGKRYSAAAMYDEGS